MKKIICTLLALCMLIGGVGMLASCAKDKNSDANGIAEIVTEKTNDGTKIIVKYADPSKEDSVFIIPDGAQGEKGEQGEQGPQGEQGIQGEKGETGRGILRVEVIDGCLWIVYTDDPETLVFIGRLDGEDETTSPEPTDPQDPPIVTPPEEDRDDGPPEKVNMNGYVYKAYVRQHAGSDPDAYNAQIQNGNNDYACIDFFVDEANSNTDAISYAVYSRNNQIESDYNCKIRQVASDGNQLQYLLTAYTSDEKFDLTIMMARHAAQAATQNLLKNLNAATYMNLTNPAFDQNSINELSVGDKLYFLSGDMNVSTLEVAGTTVVNMDFYANMAETFMQAFNDSAYENIYNIVMKNEWTMETMLAMAQMVNVDLDTSDGQALHASPIGIKNGQEVSNLYSGGDTVGYFQYLYSAIWYFYGSGGRITQKNDEGMPEFVIQNSANQDLHDYLFTHFNRKYNAPWIPHESSLILNYNFLTGDVLFADMSLFNIRNEIYPVADFEYGILPVPVLEKGMKYKSLAYFNNWAHLWAIPSLHGNTEYAERMMEIMANYSSQPNSTMSAYYDRTVYFLAAKNNDSRKVMDIIRTSMVYDLALLYQGWGGFESMLIQIPNQDDKYASTIAGIDRIIPNMEDTIVQLLDPGIARD